VDSIRYRKLNEAWYNHLKGTAEVGEEVWFVTFSFPFNIRPPVAEVKLKEWIRRLRQTLRLSEDQISCEYVYAPQLREVLHIHMVLSAKGLNNLDRKRWENKWTEITGRKNIINSSTIRTHRHAGVVRRRNGEETVAGSVIEYEKEVISSETYCTGGGSCRIEPIQKDGDGYTPEGVAGYIVARHSREVISDMQIIGRASGDF
jgi:hypothetical protein